VIKFLAAVAVRHKIVSLTTYRLERYAPFSSLMNCCICSAVNLADSNNPRLFWPKWMLSIRSLVIPITDVLGVQDALKAFCRELIDTFDTAVRPLPAEADAMVIKIDRSKWELPTAFDTYPN